MPGKIKAKIICARNLPIMDRSSDSSDAFVEVRFGANHFDKTHVFKRSLDPEWNSRFVFEVEEDEIQEEPLLIRVLDHDTYSSHDAIGKVYIDLKPLLNENGPTSIHGFLPIYDTLHGIRGEIKVQAKVEIINDCNEYRKSSCGVQFFASSKVPEGYTLQNFCGFVEELLLNDDPEYQWIDKIRTPRTSNEARQKLFTRLSGELQRRIGLKVLDMNANCVLGYQQNFDLEGEHGIVIRGIGTAANISKPSPSSTNFTTSSKATTPPKMNASKASFFTTNSINASQKDDLNESTKKLQPHSPINNNHHQISINTNGNNSNLLKLNKLSPNRVMPRIHSDSDIKTYQNQQQQISNNNQASYAHQYSIQNSVQNEQPNRQSMLEKMEYPFLTIQHYPPGFIKSLCGIVCSRSVKLLGQSGGTSSDMTESRDKWWSELRNEIRSHMKSLNCHAVLGYSETESICEDVCILSAFGTAALVDESYFEPDQQRLNCSTPTSPINYTCKLCHVPYSELDPLPLPVALSGCSRCEQGLVPDVVFTSIQPLAEVETVGRGCLIRAMVTRPRKKSSSEVGAKLVSDNLPFVEYELHRQLLGKLKLKGMNMLYGLRVEISIGENVLIGIAEATACFAAALPTPIIPRITGQKEPDKLIKKETDEMEKLRKLLIEEMDRNRAFFQLEPTMGSSNGTKINRSMFGGMGSGGSVEKQPSIDGANDAITIISQQPSTTNNDSSSSSKALFKIELDDVVEKDNIYYLLDYGRTNKKDLYTCSTEFMPGLDKFDSNVQMFTSVYRCEISQTQTLNQVKLNEICEEILETLRYKFRRYPKLCFANLSLSSSLYDDDYVMLIVTGSCLTFDEIDETNNNNNNSNNSLEGNNGGQLTNNSSMNSMQQQSPSSSAKMASDREMTANDEEGKFVDVTNLSYVPNGQIEAYLGFINIFLIRESTQIKENGGLSGFMHCFLSEVLALARAHVRSLGGNALVSCRLNQCVLLNNPHRNQAQCLVNVSGDAVRVVRNSSSYNLHRTF